MFCQPFQGGAGSLPARAKAPCRAVLRRGPHFPPALPAAAPRRKAGSNSSGHAGSSSRSRRSRWRGNGNRWRQQRECRRHGAWGCGSRHSRRTCFPAGGAGAAGGPCAGCTATQGAGLGALPCRKVVQRGGCWKLPGRNCLARAAAGSPACRRRRAGTRLASGHCQPSHSSHCVAAGGAVCSSGRRRRRAAGGHGSSTAAAAAAAVASAVTKRL